MQRGEKRMRGERLADDEPVPVGGCDGFDRNVVANDDGIAFCGRNSLRATVVESSCIFMRRDASGKTCFESRYRVVRVIKFHPCRLPSRS